LMKQIVRYVNIKEMTSFRLSNFKIFKLYSSLNNKKILCFLVIRFKFYYNLYFDVFLSVRTKESIVTSDKTRNTTKLTTLEFDDNLIKRRYTNDN